MLDILIRGNSREKPDTSSRRRHCHCHPRPPHPILLSPSSSFNPLGGPRIPSDGPLPDVPPYHLHLYRDSTVILLPCLFAHLRATPGIPRPAGYKWKFRFLRSLVYPRADLSQEFIRLDSRSSAASLQILSSADEKTYRMGWSRDPVNEFVQFRRSVRPRNSAIARISEKVETRFAKSDIPPRSDRFNRDNPGERSEHTSPIPGIITLFRSEPRYPVPSLPVSSRNSSSDPPIDCFPLVRSA